jgi:hypothetical protein
MILSQMEGLARQRCPLSSCCNFSRRIDRGPNFRTKLSPVKRMCARSRHENPPGHTCVSGAGLELEWITSVDANDVDASCRSRMQDRVNSRFPSVLRRRIDRGHTPNPASKFLKYIKVWRCCRTNRNSLRKFPAPNGTQTAQNRWHVSRAAAETAPEPAPSEPHRLARDVDPALMQRLVNIPHRQRVADMEHHRKADDLGRRLETAANAWAAHAARPITGMPMFLWPRLAERPDALGGCFSFRRDRAPPAAAHSPPPPCHRQP